MTIPRKHNRLGYLNIHIDQRTGDYFADVRVERKGKPYVRHARRFETLSCAVGYRDEMRRKYGLPAAEDDA